MRKTLLAVCLAFVLITVGCSKSATIGNPTPPKSVTPLDPQGNWLFTLNGTQQNLIFAGQLYELVSPTVTSNPMGPTSDDGPSCNTAFSAAGQASGTNTINLTVTQQSTTSPSTFTLTGTIADSQAAMSGTWTAGTA